MIKVIGEHGPLLLVSDGTRSVVINSDLNLVSVSGDPRELQLLHPWETPLVDRPSPEALELAEAALVTLTVDVVTAAGGQRMYTIPDAAQAEAKKALKWRAEHNRGGTPVGVNSARTLAKGGQIGLQKVRHIAKYFPRHEIDKKGKGWKPGEDGFPSRGRIAWALWGGDPAWRWARQIVERENNKAKTASGAYDEYDPMVDYTYDLIDAPVPAGADLDAFREAHQMDGEYGPEFLSRVRLDGSGMDRLYKIDPSGNVYVWDDGQWDDLGHVDGDIYGYDAELDDPEDTTEKSHIVIDPDSAVIISARLQANPGKPVLIEDVDADEAYLAACAVPEEDWGMVDRVVVAAGEAIGSKPGEGDGVYTPEERSENASGQVRDATGKFAAKGARVVVGKDAKRGKGTITGINGANKTVTVKLDNGQSVTVPGNTTEKLTDKNIVTGISAPGADAPLDTSGILGQPRTPRDRTGVTLPGTLPRMTPEDLQSLLKDWPSYVQEQRAGFNAFTEKQVRGYAAKKNYKIKDKPGTMVSDAPTDVKKATK